MPRGNPQTVEVVLLQLDVRALDDVEPHVAKGSFQHSPSERDRMQRTERWTSTGQADIQGRPVRDRRQEFRSPLFDGVLERVFEPIRTCADLRSLLGGKILDTAQHAGNPPPSTEPIDPPRFQLDFVIGLGERPACFRLQRLEINHRAIPSL